MKAEVFNRHQAYVTLAEAAVALGFGLKMLRGLVNSGHIPTVPVGCGGQRVHRRIAWATIERIRKHGLPDIQRDALGAIIPLGKESVA